MDQRYWAARVAELGAGSQGVAIERLMDEPTDLSTTVVVDLTQKALDSRGVNDENQPTWSARAKELQRQLMEASHDDPDGCVRNAKAVYEAGITKGVAIKNAYVSGGANACCRQFIC